MILYSLSGKRTKNGVGVSGHLIDLPASTSHWIGVSTAVRLHLPARRLCFSSFAFLCGPGAYTFSPTIHCGGPLFSLTF